MRECNNLSWEFYTEHSCRADLWAIAPRPAIGVIRLRYQPSPVPKSPVRTRGRPVLAVLLLLWSVRAVLLLRRLAVLLRVAGGSRGWAVAAV